MAALFFCAYMPVTGEKAPQRHRNRDPLGGQRRAQLGKGDVWRRRVQRPDPRRFGLGRAERVSPPYGLAAALPRSRCSVAHLTALAALTPNRAAAAAAAARRDMPREMAPTTRARRSIANGLPI